MEDKVELEVDNQSIKIALGKVYILYEHVYETIEFMGAFSTEEQAKKTKDILKEYTNNIYEIQEFELDKLTTEGTDEVLKIISNLKKNCGLEDTND